MSESILVVDDSADNRELTQILLEFDGFEVRLAEDATQALSLLKSYRPSLILMDVQFPGKGGLEVAPPFAAGSLLAGCAHCGAVGIRHGRREGERPGGGLRRLHHQADRHPNLCQHRPAISGTGRAGPSRFWGICLTRVARVLWSDDRVGRPRPRPAPWPACPQADAGVRRGPGGSPHQADARAITCERVPWFMSAAGSPSTQAGRMTL